MKWSESHSVTSECLRPHGLNSPWNSPGQNTGVGSLSLLWGIFPTHKLTNICTQAHTHTHTHKDTHNFLFLYDLKVHWGYLSPLFLNTSAYINIFQKQDTLLHNHSIIVKIRKYCYIKFVFKFVTDPIQIIHHI